MILPLTTGIAFADQYRHAVVIHAANGTRIGCGLLQLPQQYVTSLLGYRGYAGSLSPRGQVIASQRFGTELNVQFDLTDLEVNATGDAGH
jgi:hypothetical protein